MDVGDVTGMELGDHFFYPNSGDVFVFDGTEWRWTGSIMGPHGEDGAPGPEGAPGATGPAGPSESRLFVEDAPYPDSSNVPDPGLNDLFLYTNSGDFLRWDGGAWVWGGNIHDPANADVARLGGADFTGTVTAPGLGVDEGPSLRNVFFLSAPPDDAMGEVGDMAVVVGATDPARADEERSMWVRVFPVTAPEPPPPSIVWPPVLLPESPHAGTTDSLFTFSGSVWEQSAWNPITGRLMATVGSTAAGIPRGLLEIDPFTPGGEIVEAVHLPSDAGFAVTVAPDGTTYWCGAENRTTLLVYREGAQPSVPMTGLGAFGITALDFDENGVLWGAGFNPSGNVTQMFTIDPETGAATAQGASFVSPTAGFSVNQPPWALKAGYNGSLYLSYWGSWSVNGQIVRFDMGTLTAHTSFGVRTDAGSLNAFGDHLLTIPWTNPRIILSNSASGAEVRSWAPPATSFYSNGPMNVNHPEKGRCALTPQRQGSTNNLFAHYY